MAQEITKMPLRIAALFDTETQARMRRSLLIFDVGREIYATMANPTHAAHLFQRSNVSNFGWTLLASAERSDGWTTSLYSQPYPASWRP